jgi:hypothetical protein
MATVEKSSAADQEKADAEEVLRLLSEGKRVTDPELIRRIHERAEKARNASEPTSGNFSVEVIRELRGPLDEEQERELTMAQRDLLRNGHARLKDPDTGEEYVLVPVAEYERLRDR